MWVLRMHRHTDESPMYKYKHNFSVWVSQRHKLEWTPRKKIEKYLKQISRKVCLFFNQKDS